MEKRTRPYEILVRIHPDGSINAHVGEVEDIIDDDGTTVIVSRELPVKPLSLAGPEFDALIPALDQAILANNAQLLLERSSVLAERDALAAEVQRLQAAVNAASKV